MDKKIRRAAHASQGTGLVTGIRRPRRGRRRAHAAPSGSGRAVRAVSAVALVAAAGALVALAPVAPASAAVAPAPAAVVTSSPLTDVPGADGWFENLQAQLDQTWVDVVELADQIVAELQLQLAEVGDGVTHLWGILPS